jgi:hypothetical protein
MNQAVYDKLVAVARQRGLVAYADLARVADLDATADGGIKQLGAILDEIALNEIRAGRPLLAVVVIRADRGAPSKGLFDFARKHGLLKGKDDMAFFASELQRVYEAWGARPV